MRLFFRTDKNGVETISQDAVIPSKSNNNYLEHDVYHWQTIAPGVAFPDGNYTLEFTDGLVQFKKNGYNPVILAGNGSVPMALMGNTLDFTMYHRTFSNYDIIMSRNWVFNGDIWATHPDQSHPWPAYRRYYSYKEVIYHYPIPPGTENTDAVPVILSIEQPSPQPSVVHVADGTSAPIQNWSMAENKPGVHFVILKKGEPYYIYRASKDSLNYEGQYRNNFRYDMDVGYCLYFGSTGIKLVLIAYCQDFGTEGDFWARGVAHLQGANWFNEYNTRYNPVIVMPKVKCSVTPIPPSDI